MRGPLKTIAVGGAVMLGMAVVGGWLLFEVVRSDAFGIWWYEGSGDSAFEAGNFASAAVAYKRATDRSMLRKEDEIRLWTKLCDAHRANGYRMRELGDHQAAIDSFRKIRDSNRCEDSASIDYEVRRSVADKAQSKFDAGDYAEAGTLFLMAGDDYRAVAAFTRGGVWDEVATRQVRAYNFRDAGYAFAKLERHGDAGRAYEEEGAWDDAADQYLAEGDHRSAAQMFERAGRVALAAAQYAAAAETETGHDAPLRASRLYLDAGDPAASAAQLEVAYTRAVDHADVEGVLAVAEGAQDPIYGLERAQPVIRDLIDAGRLGEVVAAFHEIDGYRERFATQLARARPLLGAYDRLAKEIAEKAVNHPRLLSAVAELEHQGGKYRTTYARGKLHNPGPAVVTSAVVVVELRDPDPTALWNGDTVGWFTHGAEAREALPRVRTSFKRTIAFPDLKPGETRSFRRDVAAPAPYRIARFYVIGVELDEAPEAQ